MRAAAARRAADGRDRPAASLRLRGYAARTGMGTYHGYIDGDLLTFSTSESEFIDFFIFGNGDSLLMVPQPDWFGDLNISVFATDPDGLYIDQSFTINILNDTYDDNNYSVTTPVDLNASANEVIESASSGTTVGITAFAEDQDLSNNTVTYSLTNNPNNLFAIDSNTGVVSVYGVLDYETSNSHNITITALSADGSTDSSDFQINILNDPSDDPVTNQAPTDIHLDNLSIVENNSGAHIGNISGIDPENDILTYSVLSDHGGGMLDIHNNSVAIFDIQPHRLQQPRMIEQQPERLGEGARRGRGRGT